MARDSHAYVDIKRANRNRIYNTIREKGSVSRQDLVYDLKLSLPTITQNLTDMLEEGLLCESGSFGHTGGRRARAYSVVPDAKAAIGLDITRNHISVVVVNLTGEITLHRRVVCPFANEDGYFRKLGSMVEEAVKEKGMKEDQILGVGIAVPGLITEDHQRIFFGKILNFTGLTLQDFARYIPYPCKLFNDADAAGFAETCRNHELNNFFYISLSNNVGGSVLINRQVYKGEGPRSGEVGHMTIVPDGRPCYCGKKGCFETYCNASILSGETGGDLELFFEKLHGGDAHIKEVFNEYLHCLSIAVNNVRMLFDCKVILGGYVGAYLEDYMDELKKLAAARNTFEDNADYLLPCSYKKEALAAGAALSYITGFLQEI